MLSSINAKNNQVIILLVCLALISIALGWVLSTSYHAISIALLGGMFFFYLGTIFFVNRKIILSFYLLTIVNLDYILLLNEPFNVTVDIVLTLTIVLLTIPLIVTGKIAWHRSAIQKAFLLYLAITLLCVFLSVDPLVSVKRWLRYTSYYLILSLVMDIARDKVTISKFSRLLVYSAIAPCLIGYYAVVTHSPTLIGENLRFIYGIEMVRIKSTLSHANTFGLFLSIIIPLTIGIMLQRNGRGRSFDKIILTSVLGITLPMLYLTFSRIGWVVTFLAVVLLLIMYKRWRLLTVFPWIMGLFLWRIPGLLTRWSDLLDPMKPDSLDWRRSLYHFSLQKFMYKPIFGSGPGTFLEYVAFQKGYSQHHLWIGSLIEVGIVGTTALAILFLVVWAQLAKKARHYPTPRSYVALSVYSALMLVTVGSDPFSTPSVFIYLWALIGLVEADYRLWATTKGPSEYAHLSRHKYVSYVG